MLKLNIWEYETATIKFFTEVMYGFIKTDPLFNGIYFDTTIHQGSIRNVAGASPLDQALFPVQAEITIPWETIKQGKITDFVCIMYGLSESCRKSLAQQFFQRVSEITDAEGISIDAKGKPLSFDLIWDLLEKIDFGFDDNGNPIFPTLVIPPNVANKLKELKPTPEQEERKKRIIEEKRAKFYAKKRIRRLS